MLSETKALEKPRYLKDDQMWKKNNQNRDRDVMKNEGWRSELKLLV